MNFNYNNIPTSLKELDQWVLWKFVEGEKKPAKVPCNIYGVPSDPHDVHNQMSFQQAIDVLLSSQAGRFDGIGFVFKEGGGLTGIDLDKCIDPDTGAIDARAEEIITNMDSYTEFSVSGTGFHIIVKGKIPGKRSRKDKIEMYDSKRFFVVTGDVVGEPKEVMERQSELNSLYKQLFPEPAERGHSSKPLVVKQGVGQLNALTDAEILEKLFREPKGANWKQLYQQGWSKVLAPKYPSQSEADSALAFKLAFYTDDSEQIERIMDNSALGKREKWGNRADYRDKVITNALDMQIEKYSGYKQHILRSNKLSNAPIDNEDAEEYPEIAPFEDFAAPEFPVNIFPDWLRDYVKALAIFSQTPVDLAAMMALVSISVAVQRRFKLEVYDGYVEPLCLYAIVALPPASRKSAVFSEVIAPIQVYEAELREEMSEAIAQRKVEIDTLKAEYSNALKELKKGTLSDQSRLVEIQRKLDSTKELFPPQLVKQDITAEKLITDMSVNHNRMGVLSPEGGVLDIIAGLYSGRKTNVDIFLKGHSSEDYAYDRKNGGSIYLKAATISVGLTVQNDHLHRILSESALAGRGLLARFLYAVPNSPMGTRVPRSTSVPRSIREKYNANMKNLLTRKPTVPVENNASSKKLVELVMNAVQGEQYNEEEPTQILHLSEEAKLVYDQVFKKIEPRLDPEQSDLTSDMQFWAGKLAGQLMRIAGLLHMAEYADKDELPEEVSASTVDSASQLLEYFFAHMIKAFGKATESVHTEKQKIILQALKKAQGHETSIKWYTRTSIWKLLKRKWYKKVRDIEKDLKELEDRGYLLSQRVERHGAGRDAVYFALSPKATNISTM